MPLGTSLMLLSTKPILAMSLAYFFMGELIHWYAVLALGLMTGGISFALEPWDFGNQVVLSS